MSQHPIVIVGAGPVGLTAATILTQAGLPVIVVEKSNAPSREWRASTFHAGTLELLEPYGIVEELMSRGLLSEKVQYRDRKNGLYAEFDFNLLKDDTKYPFRLQCSQATYVQLLFEKLKKRANAELRFEAEITGFTQNESVVTVSVKTPNGMEQLQTPYLLGADGARSVVRKTLGFAFDGYTFEERWLLVGTPNALDQYIPGLAYVNYISDPEQFLFMLRVPEAWRFLYPVPPEIPDEVALNMDNIQRTMREALHTTDHFPVVENTLYRIHQRVAENFYEGRAILLGDAAHLNSPMGGLGLNSGIHDAVDLSIRLIRIVNGADRKAELDKYSDARRRVAVEYVKSISEKNTQVVKETDPEHRIKLQREMAELANDPVRARQWLLRSAMIASIREQGIGDAP
ncbi:MULTISPECIES: FAD-dependent oxidoreductase [Paenibacillus]|uniref:FAD-dependent oxidoreductase n=1 Tax=Paenibacillus validus TaxID=44253 RepID=A0A7X3CSE8_9BACL|nr:MULTISPECIES: FAD-dependent monooxygenase [Paenibacillus]MUG69942.1 FAD-dependent oxidoreductase [Paenibacillus validus]